MPNKDKVGKLTDAQLTQIAEAKMPDLNANDIDAAKKIIAGTARAMGVEVEKNNLTSGSLLLRTILPQRRY